MGFVFLLAYILLAYLSPATFFPELAAYRFELWLSLLALFTSLPSLRGSRIWRLTPMYLFPALIIVIMISVAMSGWLGGVWPAFLQSLSESIVFVLVVLNCRTPRRLRLLIFVILAGTGCLLAQAMFAYMRPTSETTPFLLVHSLETGEIFLRIRGLSFLNDPNDFAQHMLACLALLGVFWQEKKIVSNLMLCAVPALLLLVGIYLTHSRGAVVALAVLLLFALRERISTTLSVATSILAVCAMMALNVTGGRDISLAQGSDRMEAWGAGLAFLKTSPLFGIGFGRFTDNFEITAHNSVVLCASEIGLVGYFLWLAFLVYVIISLQRAESLLSKALVDVQEPETTDGVVDETGLAQQARCARLGLIAFLAAAWFLSRAFSFDLFLLLGIGTAAICNASERVDIEQIVPAASRLLRLTGAAMFISLSAVYLMLRARSFF